MFRTRLARWAPCLITLLVLALCCVAAPAAAEAATVDAAALGSGAAGPVVVGSFLDVMGDRTRMIQVTCVVVAVGVFLLSRSYR
jgi:hypothetical protein